MPGYELSHGGPGGDEREFLAHARAPAKERERMARIKDERDRAFNRLQRWMKSITRQGVVGREEFGFGYITDSPKKAVAPVVRTMREALRKGLKPL